MAKDNDLLWTIAAAAGAVFLYRWWKNREAGGISTPVTANPPSTITTPINIPQSGTMAMPIDQVMVPQVNIALASPEGIDANTYSVVQKWAQTDGRAPILAMAAANVPSEYEGMFDIISNYWDTNTPPGPVQTAFWNTLRAKYGW